MEIIEDGRSGFFAKVLPLLDERQQRLVGAAAVDMFGRGGQRRVAEASGLAPPRGSGAKWSRAWRFRSATT